MSETKQCPNCGSLMQNYRYGFVARYAYALKALYLQRKPTKISHLEITKSQKDHFHFMEYWGLIERSELDELLWQVTEKGVDFLFGRVKIPRYIWVYKAQNIPQPENDDRPNPMINIFQVGIESINKNTAMENSTPHIS